MTGNRFAPQVSFVIPAFNAAGTIVETFASLLAQTVSDWEAVIVDDGSRDRTAAIARGAGLRDPRFRLARQRNAGASVARNHGLQLARGRFVAFLDADDWIDPEFLETLLPLADNGRAIAYCAYRRVLPSGRAGPVDWCPELAEDAYRVLVERCEPAIHCVLAERQLVLDVGGFDPSLRTCEDWDLWLRLARTGIPFCGTPRPLASYRMRAASLSAERPGNGDDAVRVHRLALRADPRVPNPAPHLAQGWSASPEQRLTDAVRAAARRVLEGGTVRPNWLPDALGPDWRSDVLAEPEAIFAAVRTIAHRPSEAARVVGRLVDAARVLDPWVGDVIEDEWDFARLKENDPAHPARVGRWFSVPVDPADLPDGVEPPEGCDAVLLRIDGLDPAIRDIALPAPDRVDREAIAAALFAAVGASRLVRPVRPWRRPRLLAATAGDAARLAKRRGREALADRGLAHALLGTLARRLVARGLGLDVGPLQAGAVGNVPVLLVDRVVGGCAPLLDPTIGTDQLRDLFALLEAEGYEAIGLATFLAARRGEGDLPERPVLLAFAHADSFHAHEVGALLPPPLAVAEMMFTPAQVASSLPTLVSAAAPGVRFGCGLHAARLPVGVRAALDEAQYWRGRLATLCDGGPVAAISDRQGLADAVLLAAGFDAILSPGSAQARVEHPAPVLPAIECSGSEALGNAIECLRPAA